MGKRKLVGKVFSMQPGENSSLFKGNNGVYAFSVVETTPAPETALLDFYRNQLVMMLESRLASNSLFQSLETNAKIEDNRYLFY